MVFGLLLGIGGALIGSAIGIGALWGFGIASLIGSLFGRGDTVTVPGLADTRVQVSTYGQAIRRTYGKNRVAGNVIHGLNNLVSRTKTSEIGGGFLTASTKVKTTLYRYSYAVAFNDRQISQFQKVWLNEVLFFDISPAASAEFRSNSLARLLADINGLRFHFGTETQEPDAELITIEGTDQLPGYRGIAYIVLKNIDLAPFSNSIPQVTAKLIVPDASEADAWIDISDELTLTDPTPQGNTINESRRNHGAAVGFGFLWIAGGAVSNPNGLNTDGSVLKALQSVDDNDQLAWEAASVITPREQFEIVFFPAVIAGVGDSLYALGGWLNTGGGGESYFSNLATGDMIQRLSAHGGSWSSVPVRAEAAGFTQDIKPFPRDSFCAAYYRGVEGDNRGARIWMYGGFSTGGNKLSWVGPSDSLRDLWSFNGDKWENHTEFDVTPNPNSSADGGMGYRVYSSMTVFNDSLYMAGGEIVPGGGRNPRRDVFKFNDAGASPRFVVSISGDDVGTLDILSDIDWPFVGAGDSFSYGVYEILEWRGKMIAQIHRPNLTNPTLYFFWSDDAITWDLISDARFATLGTSATLTYRFIGDETENVTAQFLCEFRHIYFINWNQSYISRNLRHHAGIRSLTC